MSVSEVLETSVSGCEAIFEMANLPARRTGLKYQVWYSAKVEKHQPRVKVDLGDGHSISILIDSHEVVGATNRISSKDLNDIINWIDLNKEILLAYWNDAHTGSIDNGDVLENIRKI